MTATGHVLVVEDDLSVLDITSYMLKLEGYDVLTAINAREALTLLAAHQEVGVVLTDVNMPGEMDGIGLVSELHRQGNPVSCVVVSGDPQQATERLGKLGNSAAFLAKPYDRRSLLKAVGDAMPR
jgi:two-component system chemotaxis response regulator CheY